MMIPVPPDLTKRVPCEKSFFFVRSPLVFQSGALSLFFEPLCPSWEIVEINPFSSIFSTIPELPAPFSLNIFEVSHPSLRSDL